MPLFPIGDDNPTRIVPLVTFALIGATVMVFLWQSSLGPAAGEQAVYRYGVIPAVLFGRARLGVDLAAVPPFATLVTSLFMHGGWLHLGGNMLFLYIFGNNVEDAMGHGRFLLFYLVCGVLASLVFAATAPVATMPVIGASGAVSGILGAYLVLHPRARIFVFLMPVVIPLPAWVFLLFWFGGQALSAAMATASDNIAWWAHIGGFIAGGVLIFLFRRPGMSWGAGARRRRGPWG
jgi:membrane associated rhomboid family serine protease